MTHAPHRFGWIAPLALASALAVLSSAGPAGASQARVERIRVDPARAPREVLEALEGMGAECAARIVRARSAGVSMREPADVITVPGIGTKLLHRWREDLVFAAEQP